MVARFALDMENILLIYCFLIFMAVCSTSTVRYISVERPALTYRNPKYVSFANISSIRYGRQNPLYYVDLHLESLVGMNNNITVSLYFSEYISNMQMSRFFEMHFKLCDLVHKHQILGPILRQGKLKQPCPYPRADYHLYNMTMPIELIPKAFPLTKGRIYCNLTITATKEEFVTGHVDMEIKVLRRGHKS